MVLENVEDPKTVIEYSNKMKDVYKTIEEYNPDRECNVLIVFNDIIVAIICNNSVKQVVTELFIRGGRLHISTVFIFIYFLLFQFPFLAADDTLAPDNLLSFRKKIFQKEHKT